ncbi:MAG: UDP-glucuronic acid decarboxylase family protein [Candidatus Diapherotrites archaeon]
MKTVVVAGGAGFIGSHLCEFLLKKGENVICIDDLSTGDKKNIEHLMNNSNFVFMRQDITEPFSVRDDVAKVFNLASPASPVDYQKKPIKTLMVGAMGTKNCLDLAKDKKARFLQASTSEIYGDPLEHPQVESYWGNVNPTGVRSCYDEAKRFGEALVMAYRRKFNLDTKIARIFNTYGPRMRYDDGRVVPNLIFQALNKKPLTVYGNGEQTRSFCYVSDMVEGLTALMNSSTNEPVNLGNPNEMTINEFANKVIELTGVNSKIENKPLPEDDPLKRKPDITKAKELLGWEPKIILDIGLQKTIDWFASIKK